MARLLPPHRRRRSDAHRAAAWSMPVTVRLSEPRDEAALEQLAALDSGRPSPGPHLVAERDGAIEAALSLRTHELIADPFRRTAELCELLRCHAGGVRLTSAAPAEPSLRALPELVPA